MGAVVGSTGRTANWVDMLNVLSELWGGRDRLTAAAERRWVPALLPLWKSTDLVGSYVALWKLWVFYQQITFTYKYIGEY